MYQSDHDIAALIALVFDGEEARKMRNELQIQSLLRDATLETRVRAIVGYRQEKVGNIQESRRQM